MSVRTAIERTLAAIVGAECTPAFCQANERAVTTILYVMASDARSAQFPYGRPWCQSQWN